MGDNVNLGTNRSGVLRVALPSGGTAGQFLRKTTDDNYDAEWVTSSASVESLDAIVGVDVTGVTDGQTLVYDGATTQWIAGDASGGSVDLTNYYNKSEVDTALTGKADSHAHPYASDTHTHTGFATDSHNHDADYSGINHTHTGFATDSHTHTVAISDIATLESTLNLKIESVNAIEEIGDVSTTAPADGQVLGWNNTAGEWEPQTVSGGSGGVTDHGLLNGLSDDDHSQYHNDARGDARYFTQSQVTTSLAGKSDTSHNHDSDYVQPGGNVSELVNDSGFTTDATVATNHYNKAEVDALSIGGGGGGVTELTGLTDTNITSGGTTKQYWMLEFREQSGDKPALGRFELRSAPGGVNLISSGMITQGISGNDITFPGDPGPNLIDGSNATGYTRSHSDRAWDYVWVDLGSAMSVEEALIGTYNGYGTRNMGDWRIYTSDDAVTWTLLLSSTINLTVNDTNHNIQIPSNVPATGSSLVFNGTDWVDGSPSLELNEISNVSTATPSDGDSLSWNATNSNWEPAAASGGGGGYTPQYITTGSLQKNHIANSSTVWTDTSPRDIIRDDTGLVVIDNYQPIFPAGTYEYSCSGVAWANQSGTIKGTVRLYSETDAAGIVGSNTAVHIYSSYSQTYVSFSGQFVIAQDSKIRMQLLREGSTSWYFGAVGIYAGNGLKYRMDFKKLS